jgi:hypothetical protein
MRNVCGLGNSEIRGRFFCNHPNAREEFRASSPKREFAVQLFSM